MMIVGKEIAAGIYEELKSRIGELKNNGIIPHLTVILVGESPASVAYVRQKQKWGEYIGAKITILNFPLTVAGETINNKITDLNADKSVHAILVQRPLPPQIDEAKIELLVDPKKDIDGFHPESSYTLPLPLAVVKILEVIHKMKTAKQESQKNVNTNSDAFMIWLKKQKVAVLGKGTTGGGPIIKYLGKLGVRYNLIDSKTVSPDEITKNADIIISAVGKPGIIKEENIKQGVILIGAGIFRGEDGRLHGDYDEADIENKAGFYTPTPGGVGPVNVAMLMENLVTAAEKRLN